MIKRILVPTDFSACSRVALARAEEIARANGAEIFVLHVCGEFRYNARDDRGVVSGEGMAEEETTVISALAAISEQLRGRGIRARATHIVGTPHEKIGDSVAFERIDLVVMGTHGRQGLARLVLGSVAERVLRAADVPVLVCHANGHAAEKVVVGPACLAPGALPPITTILVPTDFEESSQGAVRAAFQLAEQLGAKVRLLHAYAPIVVAAANGVGSIPFEALHERAHERLREIEKRFEGSSALGKSIAVMGDPAMMIIETAAETGVDLIVVGTHGRTGLKRALLGSVAEKIVREADCAVLVAK